MTFSSLALMVPATPSQAQVNLSPLVIQDTAQRGQSRGVINLRNSSNTEMRVRVFAEPFTYHPEQGFKSLEAGEPSSLVPYLQFAPRELVIAPNSQRRVRYAVRFAPDLPDGEYRAVLFAEPLQAQDSGTTNIGIVIRTGATIYVQKGEGEAQINVAQARWDSQKQTPQLHIENLGNAMARLGGTWTIEQDGKALGTGQLGGTSILAKSDRFLSLPLRQAFPSGTYQLSGELRWKDATQPYSIPLLIP